MITPLLSNYIIEKQILLKRLVLIRFLWCLTGQSERVLTVAGQYRTSKNKSLLMSNKRRAVSITFRRKFLFFLPSS